MNLNKTKKNIAGILYLSLILSSIPANVSYAAAKPNQNVLSTAVEKNMYEVTKKSNLLDKPSLFSKKIANNEEKPSTPANINNNTGSKPYEIPNVKNIKMNEVPYLSTYYIKPTVKPGENVELNFYVTDYSHKEYLQNDNSQTFTVTIKIDGKNDIIKTVKAGDNKISLGKFTKEGKQKFSIIAKDQYGRSSHELFNFFLVQNDVKVKEYTMTKEDLIKYNIKNNDSYGEVRLVKVDLKNKTMEDALQKIAKDTNVKSGKYVVFIGDSNKDGKRDSDWKQTVVKYANDYNKEAVLNESRNTKDGIQKLILDKKAEGFNKVTLLPGRYRIDHEKPIFVPDNMTLDLNGSTIKLNQFTGNGALMIDLNGVTNAHLTNGIIEGDYFEHDYVGSPNNSEWVNGVSISNGAMYSSLTNLEVKNITGYGVTNGISGTSGLDGQGYADFVIGNLSGFSLGDIDRNTGKFIESSTRTTSDFKDISEASGHDYLSVSRYLGYQGVSGGSWNIICHFYDGNKDYIKSTDAFQYRRVEIPQGAKFMRVTLLSTQTPTDLSVQGFKVPTHCLYKDILIDNARCVGMAPAAMNNMLIENVDITASGQSGAKCAFDAEDGWDMMQDITFRGMRFYKNNYNDFLTCGGHNFIVEDMKEGSMYIWERTRGLVVRNSNIKNIELKGGGLDDIANHGVYRIYNNTVKSGNVNNNLSKKLKVTKNIKGLVSNSTLYGIVNGGEYTNCTIKVSSQFLGYLNKVKMINCDIIPKKGFTKRYKMSFDGGHEDDIYIENCNFYGKVVLDNHNNFYSGVFKNCTFKDAYIKPSVVANKTDKILFENCNFGYSKNNFIYYSPFAYTKGTYSNIEFKKCNIKNLDNNKKSFLYAYAKPNGQITFKDCNLHLPKGITIFSGDHSCLKNIEDYRVNFINSKLPKNIVKVDSKFSKVAGLKFKYSIKKQ